MDMAMHPSRRHPDRPNELCGVKLGDDQFAVSDQWHNAGRLALCAMGIEPGLSDVFARYASDHLFSRIDEIGVRDGSNIAVDGFAFAPTFSIWTMIEECLAPPVVYERERGWYTTEPFSEMEVFDFPGGIGPLECVNVEHEEVVLMPRWLDCGRVTFKYGLGRECIEVLQSIQKLGLDGTRPVMVNGSLISPRALLAATLPNPADMGDRMHGKTCAGTWVRGLGLEGEPREVYLYHLVDNAWTMENYGHQAVVWQTAINPVVALELIATGQWKAAGVVGPEAFDAVPFLDLLTEYGSAWEIEERVPALQAA
jgi:saccharopine dehydrogenase (NAD+, L-lysine forming)